jgi:hypothetical protein
LAQESKNNYEIKSLIYLVVELRCTRWQCVPMDVRNLLGTASLESTAVRHVERVHNKLPVYANVSDAHVHPGMACPASTAARHVERVHIKLSVYANASDAHVHPGMVCLVSSAARHAEMIYFQYQSLSEDNVPVLLHFTFLDSIAV